MRSATTNLVQPTLDGAGWVVRRTKFGTRLLPYPPTTSEFLPHRCDKCGRQFSTPQALASHLTYKHRLEEAEALPDQPGALIDELLLRDGTSSGEQRLNDIVISEDEGAKAAEEQEREALLKLYVEGPEDAEERPTKRRRDGAAKMTCGARKRRRHTATASLSAIGQHETAVALGFPKVNEKGNAAGTRIPWTTLFKWLKPQKRKELMKRAAAERSLNSKKWASQTTANLSNPSLLKFSKMLDKKCRHLRAQGRKLSTFHVLHTAKHVYKKITALKGHKCWPKHHRWGEWKPRAKWIRGWLSTHEYSLRKSTNKRHYSKEEDEAAMDAFLLKRRCVFTNPTRGYCDRDVQRSRVLQARPKAQR